MRVQELFEFIQRRHAIYEAREAGLSKPWTDDPILQKYRFCNVYRELDTQTQYVATKRERFGHLKDFWFMCLVFRLINWHETMEDVGWHSWSKSRFLKALRERKAAGKKIYNGAYMISTHGVQEEKALYLAKCLAKIWLIRKKIQWQGPDDSLEKFHARLMACDGIGSFIAAQVVADAKYSGEMRYASDWWTFAASGPGSRRGLNRILNERVNEPWDEKDWSFYFSELYAEISTLSCKAGMKPIHAQDLQNCLCEFDKYERVRLGEGRPKSRYKGESE